jgi:16S rRNA processing protein RimM
MTPPLLEVGRIDKAHGVRGEVLVRLTTNREERLAPGTELDTDRGPLRVEHATAHQGRWIVQFAGVGSREAADELRGTVLRAPALDDPDELWVHELIGSVVVDTAGAEHGRVVEVEANPASDLLVLESGVLVPVRFVTSVDDRDEGKPTGTRRLVVDAPPGLLDPS